MESQALRDPLKLMTDRGGRIYEFVDSGIRHSSYLLERENGLGRLRSVRIRLALLDEMLDETTLPAEFSAKTLHLVGQLMNGVSKPTNLLQ
jgi:hypothetical protein